MTTERNDLTRRRFLGSAMAAGSSLALTSVTQAEPPRSVSKEPDTDEAARAPHVPNEICCFEKPLQWMDYQRLADTLAEAGYDGVEATVRPGGHIEPERVEDELPKMVHAMKQCGLKIHVMASSIDEADHPLTEKVLRTAAGLGVQRYRLKGLKYDLNKPVIDQVKQFATRLKELAAINAQIGIQGVYQNHSGSSHFGAPVWDLHQALQGIDPKHLGVAFDIRHASAEGGYCWPVQVNLMRPHFGIVYVKDYVWNGAQAENVPLGEGRVDLKFFDLLKRSAYRGPISLHVEYHHAQETIKNPKPAIEAIRRDLQTLRAQLG
jgi:sugar phosphate isomerase/epimerase